MATIQFQHKLSTFMATIQHYSGGSGKCNKTRNNMGFKFWKKENFEGFCRW